MVDHATVRLRGGVVVSDVKGEIGTCRNRKKLDDNKQVRSALFIIIKSHPIPTRFHPHHLHELVGFGNTDFECLQMMCAQSLRELSAMSCSLHAWRKHNRIKDDETDKRRAPVKN
eukprot:gene26388-biopygen3323